jgi:hypothetical protein
VVVALGGLEGSWSPAAASATQAASELGSLAERASRGIEVHAAGYAAGGLSNLTYIVLGGSAKTRLARDLAELLAAHGRRPTSTIGGPLFTLVIAVHNAVTGEEDREGSIANAIRSAGVARTCLKN